MRDGTGAGELVAEGVVALGAGGDAGVVSDGDDGAEVVLVVVLGGGGGDSGERLVHVRAVGVLGAGGSPAGVFGLDVGVVVEVGSTWCCWRSSGLIGPGRRRRI